MVRRARFRSLRQGAWLGLGFLLVLSAYGLIAVTVSGTVHVFAGGDLVSAAMINENFASLRAAVEKADEIPAGSVLAFSGQNVPEGWLLADGSAVERTTYADLYAAIGTTYGTGDGATTFNLPDLRGEFLRGLDQGRGVDAGRALGSAQTYMLFRHKHEDPGHSHPGWGHRISGVQGWGEVTLQAWNTIQT